MIPGYRRIESHVILVCDVCGDPISREYCTWCHQCEACLCFDCVPKQHMDEQGNIDQSHCPLCTFKVVRDDTLLAFLLNELDIDRTEAFRALWDKHNGQHKPLSPLTQHYRAGYKAAVRDYAVWHDGEQFVGVQHRPLKQVLEEVEVMEIPW
jgi:hypothetical protein